MDDSRSEEHTSELQSLAYLVCRLLLEKKNSPAVDQRVHVGVTTRRRSTGPEGGVSAARAGRAVASRTEDAPTLIDRFVYFFFNIRASAGLYPLPQQQALPN